LLVSIFGAGARPTVGYPAQLKPPREPQLLAVELEELTEKLPKEPTLEIFLWVSWLPQVGQTGARSASVKRTIFSNVCLQSSH
jgi:hypothetical protein